MDILISEFKGSMEKRQSLWKSLEFTSKSYNHILEKSIYNNTFLKLQHFWLQIPFGTITESKKIISILCSL